MSLTQWQQRLLSVTKRHLLHSLPWVSTNTVTGFLAKIFGSTLLRQTLLGYSMHPSSPIPYIHDVLEYISKISFDPRIHQHFDAYSFQTTLYFCNTIHSAEDYVQLRLCSYIPFV